MWKWTVAERMLFSLAGMWRFHWKRFIFNFSLHTCNIYGLQQVDLFTTGDDMEYLNIKQNVNLQFKLDYMQYIAYIYIFILNLSNQLIWYVGVIQACSYFLWRAKS